MQPSEQDWRLRIEDILDAVERIRHYVAGMDFAAFEENGLVVDAVSYRFIVIGEAVNHIPDSIQSRAPALKWRNMRDMRNIVAHNYRGLNLRIVWQTIIDDFESLVTELTALLDASGPPASP